MAEDQTFLKEALPSRHYREYQQKQHIQNETLRYANNTIEYKRRISRSNLDREQKEVTEQLRRMQMEKAMYAQAHHHQVTRVRSLDSAEPSRDVNNTPSDDVTPAEEEEAFVNPYPVTIMPLNRNQKLRTYSEPDDDIATRGMRYARNRGRRQSKEFEDLTLNTTTGSLLPPAKTNKQTTASDADGSFWAGDPEAIHSVRRHRKSVQEQHWDFIFKRSHTSDNLVTKTSGHSQSLHRRNTETPRATTPTTARKLSSSRMSNFDSSSQGLVRKLSSSRGGIDVCVSPTGAPSLTRKISSTNAQATALGSNINIKHSGSSSVKRKDSTENGPSEDGNLLRQGSANKRNNARRASQTVTVTRRKSSTTEEGPLDKNHIRTQSSADKLNNIRADSPPILRRKPSKEKVVGEQLRRQGSANKQNTQKMKD